MSHNIFKGPLGKGEQKKGARWKPGSGEYDSGLVGDLVTLYSSGILKSSFPHWTGNSGFRDLVNTLEPYITSQADIEGMDADNFLEDIASCILQSVELPHLFEAFHTLFNPVMQVLYKHGHDELNLDLSKFPPNTLEVAGELKGNKERILKLTSRGDFSDIGHGIKHVRVEHYGPAKWVGASARSSEFILHDDVTYLGLNGGKCDYHLQGDLEENSLLYGKKNKFYFHNGLSEEVQNQIRLKQNGRSWLGEKYVLVRSWDEFFNNKNKIFIPKGEDEWEEIIPYDS